MVVDVSLLSSLYDTFFISEIIEKAGLNAGVFEETELGDFDLQGKMCYFPTKLENLKLTYLDEKAILFKRHESAELFKKLLTSSIIYSENMSETDDEDWFGEKLYYGQYAQSPINLKAGLSEWYSPALLRSYLQESNKLTNILVTTGGCIFKELQGKKILDLSRTPENHLFVEDEKHLLLGSGLSPFTARHILRSQYLNLDIVFDKIEEPYKHSSSLWDICCFHSSGKQLITELITLNTIVSVHNGLEAMNVSPALLNKLTPGLPLYFLIPKKS